MPILSATHLYKAFGAQDVFWDVDVSIAHGDKIALVGSNGQGKTTLLRILIGLEEPTAGQVSRMGSARVGYLPQDAALSGAETPWQMCSAVFGDLIEMQGRLRQLETQLADPVGGQDMLERYGRLLEAFEHAGGYAYEVEIRTVLSGLGIDETHAHRPLDQLSGGQRTRALLARLLLEKPNILALDEPTNHLDIAATEWLEEYLTQWDEAVLVVSHDRYFLNRVVHKVWDMEMGRLEVYPGNYSRYVDLRAERMARRMAEWESQQRTISQTEAYVRRYRAGQRSKEARGRQTRLERIERLERPRETKTMHLRLESDLRSGELVVVTRDLQVGYDHPLVTVPDFELRRLQRAALIGPNGSGKTTLLKTLLGEIPPLAGQARLGASLRIGYLAQTREDLDPARRVVDEVGQAKELPLPQMRHFLARYLFMEDDVFKQVGDLSGGEQCRVALAKLTLTEPNFLILDEPTNQLDIASQEIMEQVLGDLLGTILFVSHDRYLIDALSTQIWLLEGGQLKVYAGDYAEYLERRRREAAEARQEAEQKPSGPPRTPPPAPAHAARTLQDVEREIAELEARLRELEQALTRASVDQDLDMARAFGVEYHQVQADLDARMDEWVLLGEAGE